MVYGYCRVSTIQQNIERQVTEIQTRYPDAIILKEEFTGKTMDRPIWDSLYKKLKQGDLVVFDEVSRMSRNAEEGYQTYMELYQMGIDLVFLKDAHINTESYRKATESSIGNIKTGKKSADKFINAVIEAINDFMTEKVQDDIRLAFEKSEEELQRRSEREKGGINERKKRNKELEVLYGKDAVNHKEYKQIGRSEGDSLNIKKQKPITDLIRKYSKDFDGTNNDKEVLSILKDLTIEIPIQKRSGKVEYRKISAKLSRNTYYKYKREMKQE